MDGSDWILDGPNDHLLSNTPSNKAMMALEGTWGSPPHVIVFPLPAIPLG